MKKAMLPILAVLCILSGCASLLDRSFVSIAPHSEHSAAEADGSILQAETYQGLVNAVLYYVTQGVEHGVVRLSNYTRDVERDLDAACLEVVQEDPLGAYSVDFIKHTYTRVVSYYEVELNITYRRTQEQVKSIVNATGSSAIRSELRGALTAFAPERVLRISAFSGDELYMETLLRQAYYSTPSAALGMPEASVNLYPDSGTRRIVEITLRYAEDAETLRTRQAELQQAAQEAAAPLLEQEEDARIEGVFALLRGKAEPNVEGGKTAYAALLEGSADSEGMALALRLLCDAAELGCVVVYGQEGEAPRFWTIVTTPAGTRHVDTMGEELLFLTDAEMEALGFTWPREQYPECGEPIAADPVPAEETPPEAEISPSAAKTT